MHATKTRELSCTLDTKIALLKSSTVYRKSSVTTAQWRAGRGATCGRCTCACMHVHVHACVCDVHMSMCMCACVHVHVHICIGCASAHGCMCACTMACTCVHVCMHMGVEGVDEKCGARTLPIPMRGTGGWRRESTSEYSTTHHHFHINSLPNPNPGASNPSVRELTLIAFNRA